MPRCSLGPGEDELEELGLARDEARASVEALGRPVVLLDGHAKDRRPLRDPVALRIGEQAAPDAAPLVAGPDEQLVRVCHR